MFVFNLISKLMIYNKIKVGNWVVVAVRWLWFFFLFMIDISLEITMVFGMCDDFPIWNGNLSNHCHLPWMQCTPSFARKMNWIDLLLSWFNGLIVSHHFSFRQLTKIRWLKHNICRIQNVDVCLILYHVGN